MRSLNFRRIILHVSILSCFCFLVSATVVYAQTPSFPIPSIGVDVGVAETPADVSLSLQIIFLLAILTLSPSIIMMVTSFIRVSIVLNFVQRALSLQDTPPRAVVMGLSLFLTFFIMTPTIADLNTVALQPYLNGEMNIIEFYEKGIDPIRMFMFGTLRGQTGMGSLDLFLSISDTGIRLSDIQSVEDLSKIPTTILIPAFMLNEITIAFKMGIYIFIPFIVIDLVVASVLMAMGMMMLPPVMISLPLKILLFVAVDGWKILIMQLVESFR